MGMLPLTKAACRRMKLSPDGQVLDVADMMQTAST
jgi:hypothetical protein